MTATWTWTAISTSLPCTRERCGHPADQHEFNPANGAARCLACLACLGCSGYLTGTA